MNDENDKCKLIYIYITLVLRREDKSIENMNQHKDSVSPQEVTLFVSYLLNLLLACLVDRLLLFLWSQRLIPLFKKTKKIGLGMRIEIKIKLNHDIK